MYSIADYGSMISDSVRMDGFIKGLRQAVKPDSIVLDIGTGTGVFALLACQFGARKVYAIEPTDAIQVAQEIAVTNGYSERIEFIQDLSTKVALPERADIIISDLGGLLPLFQQHIPSIVDARNRLLAPDGILIPRRDTVWTAVVSSTDLYGKFTLPWEDNPYGLDMEAARRFTTNTWGKGKANPEQILLEPQSWATLDYATLESPDIQSTLTWTATRSGTGNGFIAWFDRLFCEGVTLSNSPYAPEYTRSEDIYGSVFFPWSKSVSITPGDIVSISLEAKLVGDDYIWRWNTLVLDGGDPDKVKANFRQSTFFGVPLSLSNLRKQAATYVPTLDEKGQITQFILSRMDGETSLDKIARQLSSRFPNQFPIWEKALDRVSELSKKYSR